jgi:hypothetical protein
LAKAEGRGRESGRIEVKAVEPLINRRTNDMRNTVLPVIAAAAFAAVSPSQSAQGFTLRMRADGGDTSVYYVSQNAVRYTNAANKADVVYRLDQNAVITLDARSKTYRKVSPSEARSQAGRSGGPIPAQQQEMFRRFGFDATPTVTRLGPGETIAGYATEKYLVATRAIRVEISVAPSLEMPAAYYDANSSSRRLSYSTCRNSIRN